MNRTSTFGEAPGTVESLTSAGSRDIFIAKYNPDGQPSLSQEGWWGPGYDEAYMIAIREDEQAVGTVGYADGLVTFGPGDPGETIIDYGAGWGGFFAQYTIDGVLE